MKSKDVVASIAVVLFLGLCFGLINGISSGEALAERVEQSEATKPVTLEGKLVDLATFMVGTSVKTEQDHKKTQDALTPLALETERKLYILFLKSEEDSAKHLKKMVGQNVEITGRLFEKKGVTAVEIENIHQQNRG